MQSNFMIKSNVSDEHNRHYRASLVIKENGQKVFLSQDNRTQREAIAKQLLTPSTDADHTFGVKMVCSKSWLLCRDH